jgi:serine/threonine protein kinase
MASFSSNLEKTLIEALGHASDRKHEYATPEHLLLALIDDPDASAAMERSGVDLDELDEILRRYIDADDQGLKTQKKVEPTPTAAFQRVLQRAMAQAQSSGEHVVTGANVFASMFSEQDIYAAHVLQLHFLQQQGMSRDSAYKFIDRSSSNDNARAGRRDGKVAKEASTPKSKKSGGAQPAKESKNVREDLRALPPGTMISDYKIGRVLGQGGFGITYLATDVSLNQKIAIKEYFPREFVVRDSTRTVRPTGTEEDHDNFKWGFERFRDEAKLLARLRHPNVVAVRRLLEGNGTLYLVMDYCEGKPLDKLIKDHGPLPAQKLDRLFSEVKEALRSIHDAKVIHRDIKPANIYVRDDGSSVLLDFGSARQYQDSHSRSMTALYSEHYAAFEQYSASGTQDSRTDIYGFAATLYFAATGQKPQDAVARSRKDKLIPLTTMVEGKYPVKLLKAIDAGLAIFPEDRPQRVEWWGKQKPPFSKTEVAVGGVVTLIGAAFFVIKKFGTISLLGAAAFAWSQIQDPSQAIRSVRDFFSPTEEVAATAANTTEAPSAEEANTPIVSSSDPGDTDPLNRVDPEADIALSEQTEATEAAKVARSVVPTHDKLLRDMASLKEAQCPEGVYDNCAGEYNYSDEEKYMGYFKNGERSGFGIYQKSSSHTYVGYQVKNQENGLGKAIYAQNGSYVGYWKSGLREGYGVLLWANGDRYEGQFQDGKRSGYGVFFQKSGRYEGHWKVAMRDGYGVEIDRDGNENYGYYEKDRRIRDIKVDEGQD